MPRFIVTLLLRNATQCTQCTQHAKSSISGSPFRKQARVQARQPGGRIDSHPCSLLRAYGDGLTQMPFARVWNTDHHHFITLSRLRRQMLERRLCLLNRFVGPR